MSRALIFAAASISALACCAQAFALSSATAQIHAKIVAPAGVNIVTTMVLPAVIAVGATPQIAGGSISAGGSVNGTPGSAIPGGNATLTIHGQAGDTVSTAIPESFQVMRTGGSEALTVTTNTNAQFGLSSEGALAGTVMNGNTMSVNVGGSLSLASANTLVPGPYEGLLVVLVQYN